MSEVSFVLILFVLIGKFMESSSSRRDSDNVDYDSAWEELFGHLSGMPTAEPLHANVDMSDSKLGQNMDETDQSKSGIGKHHSSYAPPIPPAPPFAFDPDEQEKNPGGVGAHSYGNMEGIAISQNGGVALGMYIMNSSYNNFNTLFGSAPLPGKGGSKATGMFQKRR